MPPTPRLRAVTQKKMLMQEDAFQEWYGSDLEQALENGNFGQVYDDVLESYAEGSTEQIHEDAISAPYGLGYAVNDIVEDETEETVRYRDGRIPETG